MTWYVVLFIMTDIQIRNEGRSLLKKYYDNPRDNAAFDRCIDVMTRLILKYGKQVLESQESDEKNKIIKWDARKKEKIAA